MYQQLHFVLKYDQQQLKYVSFFFFFLLFLFLFILF